MFDILTDSAASIPAAVAKKHSITVIPFPITLDEKPFTSFDPELTPEQEQEKAAAYYDAIRKGAKAKSSLVNVDTFISYFTSSLSAGRDVLCFTLSKNISGTYNAARLAAEALKEDYPERTINIIDSLNAGLAQGILTLDAAELRRKGKTLSETTELTEEAVSGMNGVFTVDNLKYLAATGRIRNVEAILGGLLNLKVILRGSEEGFIVLAKTVRGRKKALQTLVDYLCKNILYPDKQIIGITNADCQQEASEVMEMIKSRINVRGFLTNAFDYCSGSHVGPGAIGLFFLGAGRALNSSLSPVPRLLNEL